MLFQDVHCSVDRAFPKIGGQSVCQTLLDLIWEGVVEIDRSLKPAVTYCNNYGLGEGDLQKFFREHAAELYAQANSYPYRVLQQGELFFHVLPLRESEEKGTVTFCLNVKVGPYDPQALEWHYYVSIIDYEKVQVENALEQAEEHLANVFSVSETISIFFDMDLNIRSMNAAAHSYFGEKEHISELEIENIGYLMDRIGESLCRGERVYPGENILCADNERILSVTIGPFFNKAGRMVGGLLVGVDITENSLLAFEQQILNRFSVLGETAAMLAHDIKNPLMNIRACAQMLENSRLGSGEAELCTHIIHEADRIKQTIDQMFSYARAVSGDDYERVHVNKILSNCASMLKKDALNRCVSIELELGMNLPFIQAINMDLQQVFFRIMNNGLDAMSGGGVLKVTSACIAEQGCIQVCISDCGEGIAQENMNKLFKPYFTTKAHGTGMGLFSAKRIVEKYKGTITFRSAPGMGTDCTICLPL